MWINLIPNSWAFEAFGYEKLSAALKMAEEVLLTNSFRTCIIPQQSPIDLDLIKEAAYVCEIASLEWWETTDQDYSGKDSNVAENFSKICSLAFTLLKVLPIPEKNEDKFSHVLRVIALGYCADCAIEVRSWVSDAGDTLLFTQANEWNEKLAAKILETWVRLVRRKNWDDVSAIAQIITTLRKEQIVYEGRYLESLNSVKKSLGVWQLVSFYHWVKATEVLAEYMLQGTPADAGTIVNFHFEKAFQSAEQSGLFEIGNLLRWLQIASKYMMINSIWNVSKRFNSNITRYIEQMAYKRTMLELLPPQRRAIFQQGLLDRTHNAIVVSLPTSSGKTQLAIFRILEAYNHFGEQGGWIAYTAPTRALVNQIANRLRKELLPLNIKVVRLSGALEVDQAEEDILADNSAFDVLVCTPEKLDTVIRKAKISKELLVLYIMDEAQNIEDKERGLKHELLLAMIKRDCPSAKLLLMTPYVSNGLEIARWLDPQAPGSISLTIDWKPNDRIIGTYQVAPGARPREWTISYKSRKTSHPSLMFEDVVQIGDAGPLPLPFSKVKNNLTKMSCAATLGLKERGSVLLITQQKPHAWSAARTLKEIIPAKKKPHPNVIAVQRFLEAEFGNGYELIDLLNHGIGVHHSGLSDNARYLMEWLTEEGYIDVLCATTTIAQGINFPVNSILLTSTKYPRGINMSFSEFWNLIGRAGRVGQSGVGLIGIASTYDERFENEIERYLQVSHSELLSSLLTLYEEAKQGVAELDLNQLADNRAWSSFLQYLAHLYNQSDKERLEGTRLELTLRDTYGYLSLERRNPQAAKELVSAIRKYLSYLSKYNNAKLAENTGFAPDNALKALLTIKDEKVTTEDWHPDKLFAPKSDSLRKLMGIMLRIPELSKLGEISGHGLDNKRLAELTVQWVNGADLSQLAQNYFNGSDAEALSRCCDAIYGNLTNTATWGLSSLRNLSIDFDKLDEEEKRLLNLIPAMVYYGVNTEEAVIMRMNNVPRSLAQSLGTAYKQQRKKNMNSLDGYEWLEGLKNKHWEQMKPQNYPMNGKQCRMIWRRLSGLE